jgi:hypothetical protein
MFVPVVMNLTESDVKRIEKDLFISFRKNLKKLLRDEYRDIFGEVCDEPLSKNIMLSLKDRTIFNGDIVKHDRNLNHMTCGILMAHTVFTMFQMLCSLQAEHHVKSHMAKLAGIVNDVGRGFSAVERIVHVMNTIYDLSSNHDFFDIVQDSVTDIEKYLDRTFGCEIECTSD